MADFKYEERSDKRDGDLRGLGDIDRGDNYPFAIGKVPAEGGGGVGVVCLVAEYATDQGCLGAEEGLLGYA